MRTPATALLALSLLACNPATTADSATTSPTIPVAGPPPALVINEIMAANATGLTDEGGAHPDWIELFNPTDEAVSLLGWRLVNNLDQDGAIDGNLSIGPGQTLVFFADNDPEQGPNHLSIRLDAQGEWLGLLFQDQQVDGLTWGPLIPDVSLARSPDAAADWVISSQPTPDASNGGTAVPEQASTSECGPSIALDNAFLLEQETVTAIASCTGDLSDFDSGFTSARGDLPGVDWSWTPNLDEAGELPLLFWTKQRGTTGVPETAVVTIGVADAWNNPNNIAINPETYTTEWGLPVLHLAPSAPPSQEYQSSPAWFDGVSYEAQMKIRGAASAAYPKNNYTLEFDPIQIDLSGVGLQNKDRMVLISNFDDNSYVRQALVYDVWTKMAIQAGEARMTPRTFPVVVYVNNNYEGLFLGIDHINAEFIREMGFLDGGNLYKSVSHDANFYLTNASGGAKSPLSLGWEKKQGLPETDFTDLEALTQWSGSIDAATFAAEQDAHLYASEFVDWFLLVHHLAADDSAGKNAYLYAEPGSQRFRYVPWDFNHALGQTWQTARQGADSWNLFTGNNALFWHTQTDPVLSQAQWDRYDQYRAPGGPLNLTEMNNTLDAMYAQIGPNADRDWQKWGAAYRSYGGWSWRSDFTTPAEERDYLYQWLADRDAQ